MISKCAVTVYFPGASNNSPTENEFTHALSQYLSGKGYEVKAGNIRAMTVEFDKGIKKEIIELATILREIMVSQSAASMRDYVRELSGSSLEELLRTQFRGDV